jgi:hypothetical protein
LATARTGVYGGCTFRIPPHSENALTCHGQGIFGPAATPSATPWYKILNRFVVIKKSPKNEIVSRVALDQLVFPPVGIGTVTGYVTIRAVRFVELTCLSPKRHRTPLHTMKATPLEDLAPGEASELEGHLSHGRNPVAGRKRNSMLPASLWTMMCRQRLLPADMNPRATAKRYRNEFVKYTRVMGERFWDRISKRFSLAQSSPLPYQQPLKCHLCK